MIDFSILNTYAFWVVAASTCLLAIAASLVGALNVFRSQSLIGDAIGHSAFPGIVLAFMLFLTRNPYILLAGAILSGALAFAFIQVVHQHSRIKLDSLLAIALSGFFGLGMVLMSHVQGNENYINASQSGLQNYIFGQAAYMGRADALRIAIAGGICLLLLLCFYKPLKVYIFDPTYAHCLGYRPFILNALLLFMTILLIALGLKSVGAILISSLFIAPIVSARLWSSKLGVCLMLSALFAGLSAIAGTAWSTLVSGLPTGPAIIVILTGIAILSLLLAPGGLVQRLLHRKHILGGKTQ